MKVEDKCNELTNKLGLTGVPKIMIQGQIINILGIVHDELMERCSNDSDKIDKYFKEIMGVE